MDYNLDSGKFDFVDFDGQQARYRLGHSCNTTNLDLREQGLNLLKVMDLSHDPFLKAFKRSCVRYARIGLRIDSRLVLSRYGYLHAQVLNSAVAPFAQRDVRWRSAIRLLCYQAVTTLSSAS
jgi:hypothetical protein